MIQIRNKRLLKIQFLIIALLTIAHTVSYFLATRFHSRYTDELYDLFWFDQEGNMPTLFSTCLLLIAALLFWTIGSILKQNQKLGRKKWWFGLAIIFLSLAIDEAVQIHEKFDSNSLLSFVNTSGLLAWPWVILYGSFVIAFTILYFRFWLSFSWKYRIWFMLCALLYVTGAIGFEMLGANEYTSNGRYTGFYRVLVTIEELLEMSSISLLIYGLLLYIEEKFSELRVAVTFG